MLGAQKWLVEYACFSTSSGVEIRLKLAVSKVAAKATALEGGGGLLRIAKDGLEPGRGLGGRYAQQGLFYKYSVRCQSESPWPLIRLQISLTTTLSRS